MTTRRLAIPTAALLAAALVAPAALAEPVILRLTNGDTLRGELVSRTDAAVEINHPYLGTVSIPTEQIANSAELPAELDPASPEAADVTVTTENTVAPAPALTPDALEPPAEEEAIEEVKPGLFGTNLLTGWDRSFSLGVYGSEGNTQELDVTAQLDAAYEDETDRWLFNASWFYGTEDGDTTDNEILVSLRKDWLIPDSRWFFFALGTYEYDDFEAYQHRITGNAGVGYEFIKEDDITLRGLAGVGAQREFGSDNENITPEALLGVEFMWKPFAGQTLTASHYFYPELERFDERRNRNLTKVEYTIDIDRDYGLSFKVGAINEYESQTDDDSFHNDFDYYAAIVYGF
ncbi:MAG: DUF481 domain-containing protein [Planctomycetota bacterium]